MSPAMESLSIEGSIITHSQGDAYNDANQRNSSLSVLKPTYIAFPAVATDIPVILKAAQDANPPLEIAVKCGGAHSATWASNNGGVVIDIRRMNAVTIAPDKSSVTIQGGAIWGDVYTVTREAGIDVVGGPFWFVGVGGYLSGGGYSPFSSVHGMGLDNILSATVVLADGRIVNTSETEEPDLFWAIRGGGNQFGIVVEFVIKAFPTWGPFIVGALAIPGKEIDETLRAIQGWKSTFSAHEKITITFGRPGPHFNPVVTILPWIAQTSFPSSEIAVARRSHTDSLAPFRALGPVLDKVVEVPDMLAVSHASDAAFAALPKALIIRGTLVADLWEDVMREVWDLWLDFTASNEGARSSSVLWDLTRPDGIEKFGPGETAFHARKAHYWVAIQGRSASEESLAVMRKFTSDITAYIRDRNAQKMRESHPGGADDVGYFLNFAQGDESPEMVHGSNLSKLRKLKARYDPKGLWSRGVFIEPDFD
ncbi:hypothetical protein D9619_006849 [Psilocybe cf. subviscida]|uniref:FAD-binding PCMH-type domain-containing protein n=1 Tax=Psilocybe cf. subviscida TaxID=2480587 RepID=A0A8H5EYC4_9AGAR|nr:hypothetical protein D9619_006849 [Psilocybe cf. subviscida]